MPKIKTKKIVLKRFKVTKSGKIMHRIQGARHKRSVKNKSRQRRQDKPVQIKNRKFERVIKGFLGI